MFGYPKKNFASPYYLAPRDENPKNQRYQISNRFEPNTHVQKEEKTLNTDVELRSAREHVFSFLSLKFFPLFLGRPLSMASILETSAIDRYPYIRAHPYTYGD